MLNYALPICAGLAAGICCRGAPRPCGGVRASLEPWRAGSAVAVLGPSSPTMDGTRGPCILNLWTPGKSPVPPDASHESQLHPLNLGSLPGSTHVFILGCSWESQGSCKAYGRLRQDLGLSGVPGLCCLISSVL